MPYVQGAKAHGVIHVADVYRSNNVFVNGVPVALWDEPGPTSAFIDNVYLPHNPYKPIFVEELVAIAGANAPNDDDEGSPVPGLPADPPEATASTTSTQVAAGTTVPVPAGIPVTGSFITNPIDYNQKLSPNYAIKDFSIKAFYKHNIIPQVGLSVDDIIKNLQGVAVNIVEPLRVAYPGFTINSGFRKGDGASQHNKGMAVDFQWHSKRPREYDAIADWVVKNLPFDDLIFEHGNSIWLHISYNRNASRQRGKIRTYYPANKPEYKPGLTNYYANR